MMKTYNDFIFDDFIYSFLSNHENSNSANGEVENENNEYSSTNSQNINSSSSSSCEKDSNLNDNLYVQNAAEADLNIDPKCQEQRNSHANDHSLEHSHTDSASPEQEEPVTPIDISDLSQLPLTPIDDSTAQSDEPSAKSNSSIPDSPELSLSKDPFPSTTDYTYIHF